MTESTHDRRCCKIAVNWHRGNDEIIDRQLRLALAAPDLQRECYSSGVWDIVPEIFYAVPRVYDVKRRSAGDVGRTQHRSQARARSARRKSDTQYQSDRVLLVTSFTGRTFEKCLPPPPLPPRPISLR